VEINVKNHNVTTTTSHPHLRSTSAAPLAPLGMDLAVQPLNAKRSVEPRLLFVAS